MNPLLISGVSLLPAQPTSFPPYFCLRFADDLPATTNGSGEEEPDGVSGYLQKLRLTEANCPYG